MLIIPAIDLKDGCCVRLTEGREDSAKVYDANPVKTALDFQSAGGRLIHIVDLDAAFQGGQQGNREIIRKIIHSLDVPVEVGGGIRGIQDIEDLVNAGARYVILGTLAVERPNVLQEAVDRFGDAIVAGIDARGLQVATRGWVENSGESAIDLARRMASIGVRRIIYTDISRDGKLEGPAVDLTQTIARESGLKVTASGGVSSLEDIRHLAVLEADGVDSVIVGKALYEGRFTVAEAIQAAG